MKTTVYILSLMIIIFCCLFPQTVEAYKSKFHEEMTETAVNESDLDSYLESNLGFDIKQKFRGPVWVDQSTNTIKDWIIYGSWKEDNPVGPFRARKHFYNPTSPLYVDHLTDPFDQNDYSALERAKIHTDDEEPYSWEDIRNYYYNALTTEREKVNIDDGGTIIYSRNWSFAQTFRGLGQVLHLLQDMGVPAHVRNDAHIPIGKSTDTYEDFVRELPAKMTINPVKFDTFDHYWDSDVNANVYGDGLAEYTNYNFVSDDTIFKDVSDQTHYFPYPRIESTNIPVSPDIVVVTAEDGIEDTCLWFRKEGDGEDINPFLAGKFFYNDLPDGKKTLAVDITDEVVKAYRDKLVPKTISYCAGLINHFFRGKFEVSPEEVTGSTITVTNRSGEDITGGVLKLYYDYQKKGEEEIKRFEVPEYSSTDIDLDNLVLNDGDDFTLNFSPIVGVANYIIVFKGTLGEEENQEENVVIGKVFKGKFPSITELMRAINERESAAGRTQTVFYNRTTGESLGVPDGGVNIPALDALDGCPLVIQDLRYPIQGLASHYWSGLYDTYGRPKPYDWQTNSPYNLYHIAMGEGWDWGYFGEEMYIEEISKCIETLIWVINGTSAGVAIDKWGGGETYLKAWNDMLGNTHWYVPLPRIYKRLWKVSDSHYGAYLYRFPSELKTNSGGITLLEVKHSFSFIPKGTSSLPITVGIYRQDWAYVGKCPQPWALGSLITSFTHISSDTQMYTLNIPLTHLINTAPTKVVFAIVNDEAYPGGADYEKSGEVSSYHYTMIRPEFIYPVSP